ncbi:MAG: PknH-like extracellular domain, partial [Mycobacterium sp.]|nr:PknH-like extracellular domain [Mycobacterium sp.]
QLNWWKDCQYQTISSHSSELTADQTAVVGGSGEVDGIATLQITPNLDATRGVVCQRALTPVGNVLVDVRACSNTGVGDNGVTIARDIATKIKGG